MKKTNFILAIVVISLILSANIVLGLPMELSPRTIYIESAEDLYNLSRNCSYDYYSKGLNVVLQKDIDIKDNMFVPIPIFSGTFEGNGHAIKGLSVKVEGSNQGLFRYLQKDGIIKNLKVEGVIAPNGEKSNIGAIVGRNNGLIENCSFSGYIKGKDTVGGLVGWNGTSGIIIESSSNGKIYGERKVGGIAGYNAGTILRCTNESGINTTVIEPKISFDDIDIVNMDIEKLSKLSPNVTDIGGISGVNTGIVQNSQNNGIIGYPHVGYNVGGIAGRQNGYIAKCLNNGTIYGRKEVGGIIGQMEPHISIITSPSKLNKLHNELNTLQTLITKMINDTTLTSNEMTQKLSSVQQEIDSGKTHAKNLFDLTEKFINKDIKEINTISVTAVEAIDKIIPITEALSDAAEIMEESISPIQKSLNYLIKAMDEISELSEEYDELSSTINFSINKIKEAQNNIKESNSNIKEALKLLKEGKIEGALDLLKSSYENLKKAKENIVLAFNNLKNIEGIMAEMMESMGSMSNNMNNALKYMSNAIKILKKATDDINDIFDGVNDLLTYLANTPPLKFVTTDEEYQKTKEELFDSMTDMSNSLSEFIKTINVQGMIMMNDMQMVSDQLFLVLDLTFNLVDDLVNGEINVENMVDDISRKDTDKNTEGKVSNCKNLGNIEGDINVGGIAGAMSIEIKYDPEEDSSVINNRSINVVFQTSAVIQNCENNGKIIAKKNNVGGITGNMDLGFIKDCVAQNFVESTEGNYVGGIAGNSNSPIVHSYAKCTLNGGNYVGGIAGFGTEIKQCYSLVKINRFKACVGAIAGDIDKNNIIEGNYFVSDILAGIDGISYKDKAEPITYNELLSIENLPLIFKGFQLTFLIDGRVIDTLDFSYGDFISKSSFPNIPKKDGYYGTWEEFNEENITYDNIIDAKYTPYLTVLESMQKRNEALSIVLVEGNFTNEDCITLSQNDNPSIIGNNETTLEQWNIIIPNDGNTSHIIRYLPPEGKRNIGVYIAKNGEWVKVNSQWDGKYLLFETHINPVTFCIADKGVSYGKYIALAWLMLFTLKCCTYFIHSPNISCSYKKKS